jgi:DNA helicase-2/ATP-dependent DNA helicase PcrA
VSFTPRPCQKDLLETYLAHGGKMGISAVPGSGKTHTLSYLAAQLVAYRIEDDQEVLIVTLVNSAVDNFRLRVAGFIEEMHLLAGLGYRVRTLHGLAHDIVRQRPSLAGLADDFVIVDEGEAAHILDDSVAAWLREHPHFDHYLALDRLSEKSQRWVARKPWPELALSLARAFIKRAKDWRLTPEQLGVRLTANLVSPAEAPLAGTVPLTLAGMAVTVYADYQRALVSRGGVDFDDLIRLAHRILELDADFLARLRRQWPYVLEDEAQDSSRSQEDILRLLAGHPEGNWVRVGDTNQAIYHTFTNASPQYLRDFIAEKGVVHRELPNSGRSQPSIIRLANDLVMWVRQEHPVVALRDALVLPLIQPSPPDDPQPNPPDDPAQVCLIGQAYAPEDEVKVVVATVKEWLSAHGPDSSQTVAILVPSNKRGATLADALRQAAVPTVELLDNPPATRSAAGVLGNVLRHLSEPTSSRQLATLFHVWQRADWDKDAQKQQLRAIQHWLAGCRHTEAFLWPPGTASGWDGAPSEVRDAPESLHLLAEFRNRVRRWQAATALPVDQLLLTLAQDLFTEATDLALTHKLAVELRHLQGLNPDWRLPELTEELATIARNERRFMGFTEAAYQAKPGEVTVATMHRAKGLEWDRVYLTSVNNYDFPSAEPEDAYLSERWFVRDRLNLEAEALRQLEILRHVEPRAYVEGEATLDARLDYAAERLRLFYVGITRARRELIVTWNTGHAAPAQSDRAALHQATAFLAVARRWQTANDEGQITNTK